MKRKKIICAILLVCCIFGTQSEGMASEENYWKTEYSDGWGDVANAEELIEAIENEEDFYLDNDIDMSMVRNWEPKDIKGIRIDGQGHSIKNLTIVCDDNDKNVGFFSSLSSAEIKNLGFKNITILVKGDSYNKDLGVGMIAGNACEETTIDNCYTDGMITINSDVFCSQVGGVVGRVDDAYISKCSNKAKILLNDLIRKDYSTGDNSAAGGLVGYLKEGSLTDSYNTGEVISNIKSNHYILGGLAGCADTTVKHCYNVATVGAIDKSNKSNIGGICGFVSKDGIMDGCYRNKKCAQYSYYYSKKTTDKNNITGCLEDAELKLSSSYKDWDFEKIWAIDSGKNQGYPYLQTFKERVSTPVADVEEGNKEEEITVQLSCLTPGAEIYYTTNGRMPTQESARYSGPLSIRKNTHLVAVAFKNGMEASRPGLYDYNYKYLHIYASKESCKFQKKLKVRFSTDEKGAKIYYSVRGKKGPYKRYKKAVVVKKTTDIWVKAQKGYAGSDRIYHWKYKKVKNLAKTNSRIYYIRGYHKNAFNMGFYKYMSDYTKKYNVYDQTKKWIGAGRKSRYYDLDGDGKKEKIYVRKTKGIKYALYINGKKRTTIWPDDCDRGVGVGIGIHEFQGKRLFTLRNTGANDYTMEDKLCIWRKGKFKVLHKMELSSKKSACFSGHYVAWDKHLKRKVIYYDLTRQYSVNSNDKVSGLPALPRKARKIYGTKYYKRSREFGNSVWRHIFKKYTYKNGKLKYLGKDECFICGQGAG